MKFVDTNIFVRFLAEDDPSKADATRNWFDELQQGDEEATTSELVIGEVVYVLSSRNLYAMDRSEIAARLAVLVSLPQLRIENRAALLQALGIYAEQRRLDFTDALTVAHMERLHIEEVLSDDRDFDAVPGVTRIEP